MDIREIRRPLTFPFFIIIIVVITRQHTPPIPHIHPSRKLPLPKHPPNHRREMRAPCSASRSLESPNSIAHMPRGEGGVDASALLRLERPGVGWGAGKVGVLVAEAEVRKGGEGEGIEGDFGERGTVGGGGAEGDCEFGWGVVEGAVVGEGECEFWFCVGSCEGVGLGGK